MHTLEIPDRGETYGMASEMHELNTRQYIEFCRVLQLIEAEKITNDKAELLLVISFADVKFGFRYAFMGKGAKEKVHHGLLQLTPLTKSVFKEKQTESGEVYLVPSISFTDNKIPRYRGLVGPADALTNCTFYEYKQAYAAWMQYQETQEHEFLNEMIAVLYRPAVSFSFFRKRHAKFSGDIRKPLTVTTNPLFLQKRIKEVAKWPAHIKFGIWLWFTACMEYLRSGKPVIDGIEIDLSILYKGEGGGSAGIGITGLLYSLAETGVFGNIEETGNTNIYDVFARLYQVKLQMDEAISNLKKK